MTKMVAVSLTALMLAAAGCGSGDATHTVQTSTETVPYVELRGLVPGGLLKFLGSDADVATAYGCFSKVSPTADPATSTAATKCTITFRDVKRTFVRTSGGTWEEIEP
jgi:hypothetical protein